MSSFSALVSQSFLTTADGRNDNEQQGNGDDHYEGLRLTYSAHVVVFRKGKVILISLVGKFKAGNTLTSLQTETL